MIIFSVTLLALCGFISQTGGAEIATMSKNLKVLVSSNDYPEAGLEILREHFTVLQSRYLHFGEEGITQNKEELLRLAPGISALVWVSHHPITKELLDKAGPSLKVVATVSAGYNHCNVDELKARGIKLSNTPDVLSSAVAEIAIALMLGAGRRFTENLEQVHSGQWEIGFQKVLGQEIRGSTVGVFGLGGIGQAIVKRLAGFEVEKFLYTGHREKPEAKALGAHFVTKDELLAQSDFVILAVPLTNETKLMVNSELLGKMKKNAILINVGRGDLVDQAALYDALKNKMIYGAGLDVTTPEPLPRGHQLLTLPNLYLVDQAALYDALKNKMIYGAGLDVTTPEPLPRGHQLLTLPNLFVLPHIGSATVRTRDDMATLAARNLVQALAGKPLLTPVLP